MTSIRIVSWQRRGRLDFVPGSGWVAFLDDTCAPIVLGSAYEAGEWMAEHGFTHPAEPYRATELAPSLIFRPAGPVLENFLPHGVNELQGAAL